MGMCEQAELMREKVRDSGFVLVAGRQAQRGGPSADRIAKGQPVLPGELGDHVGRHALGERRPAEDRVDRHRLVPAGYGRAETLEETEAANLADDHGESEHIVSFASELKQLPQPRQGHTALPTTLYSNVPALT